MNETWECSYSNPVKIGDESAYTTAFASSTCVVSTPAAATSTVATNAGFTYGELVQSFFLFLIFLVVSYQFIFNWTHGIKIGKKGV